MTVSAIDPKQIIHVPVARARGAWNVPQRRRSVAHLGGHGETEAPARDVVPDPGARQEGGHPMLHEPYPGLARSLQLGRQR